MSIRSSAAPKSGSRDYIYSFCGSVLSLFGTWVLFTAIGRLLDVTAAADFVVAMSIATPFFVLSGMLLRQSFVVDANQRPTDFAVYFWHRILSLLLATVLIGLAWPLLSGFVNPSILAGVVALKSTEMFLDILLAPHQYERAFLRVAIFTSLRGLIASAVSIGLIWRDWPLGPALGIGAATTVVLTVIAYASVDLSMAPSREVFKKTKSLTVHAAPLAAVAGLAAIDSALPRVSLQLVSGPSDLAQFAAAGYFLIAANTLGLSVSQVLLSTLPKLQSGSMQRSLARRASGALTGVGLAVGAFLALVPLSFVELIYGPNLTPSRELLVATGLAIAARLGAEPWKLAVRAVGKYSEGLAVQLCASGFMLATALAAIPYFAGVGAAAAILVAAVISGTGNYWRFTRAT